MKNSFLRILKNYGNKRFRRTLAVFWLLSLAFFGYQVTGLKVSFEFEKLFGEENSDRQFYEQHLEVFGYDNDYLLVIVEAQSSVFDSVFLQKVSKWSKQSKKVEGVESLVSPVEIPHLIKSPLGITAIALIHSNSPARYASDSVRIYSHPIYKTFFSENAKALLIQITHKHFKSPQEEKEFITQLNKSLTNLEFSNYRVIGKLIAQRAFIDNIKKDFSLFLTLALIVTAIILLLIYRSIRGMLLPYLVSISTMIFLLGIMALIGVELSVLSVLIPPIILFVATSDGIHLLNAYRQNKSENYFLRLNAAITKVFVPTLLTSVTTAIGFISLLSIPSKPVQELGLFAGLGVVIAFLVTFIFGPLLLSDRYKASVLQLPYKQFTSFVLRRKRPIFIFFVIVTLLSLYGLFLLKTDAYLLKDLPEKSKVKQDFEFVDQNFGGSKPWEMAIWPADSNLTIWNYEFINEASKIGDYLQEEFGIERLFSPVEMVKYGHQIEKGGANRYFKVPSEVQYKAALDNVDKLKSKAGFNVVTDSSETYARFAAFIPEWGSFDTRKRNEALENFIQEDIDTNILNYRITGTTYLIDQSNESISINSIYGLLIATALISIVLALYFKSMRILIVSLVPNFIPLLLTAGVMGYMDAPLKLTTSIIFVVAFGIAVDDTIHFLGAFKNTKAVNYSWRLVKTFRTAGLSICITSLLIISGFVLFTFSAFATTFYLGLFLSLAMFSALVTDLLLLPLLLNDR